jgi:hypothetical protein
MKRALIIVAAVAAIAAFAAPAVSAASAPDSRLDALASSIAGHPVTVWCESSWGDWIHTGDSINVDFSDLLGFTNQTSTTIYISPGVCETWHVLLNNSYIDSGDFWTALAIHTLVHESVHQRGIADEGAADCTALQLDPAVDGKFVAPTFTVSRQVAVGSGKNRRIVTRKVTVANQDYQRVVAWQHFFHKTAPPEYQGGCS